MPTLLKSITTLSQKNRTTTINMTQLHQFTTFTDYFWQKDALFNFQFTKLNSFKLT